MTDTTPLPGVSLNPSTAVRVKQLVQEAAPTAFGATSDPLPRRQVGWVQTTSGTPSSGWYPGVITTQIDGSWVNAADVCEVQAANGATLVNGNRYWCERTGPSATNVMRYVAVGYGTFTYYRYTCNTDGTLTETPYTVTF